MTTTSLVRAVSALMLAALAFALLPALSGVAEGNDLSVEIRPAIAGNTAVRVEQDVIVSGSAPAGTTIDSARLVGLEPTGGRVFQPVPATVLNKTSNDGWYLRVTSSGNLEGRLGLGCYFGPPTGFCSHDGVREVLLEVVVGGQSGSSGTLRVDYTRPFIRRYDLVTPTRIRVLFSEPVRNANGDSRNDWEVTQPQRTVLRVEGPTAGDCVGEYLPGEDATAGETGCTRTLVLLNGLDEDARPHVETRVQGLLARGQYDDFASNVAFIASHGARSFAFDRIRAPLPRIEAVAGSEPDDHNRTTGNTSTPDVTVSNLRAGHTLHFEVNGERIHEEVADAGTHTARLPDLGLGAEFDIHVLVEDLGGNLSTEGHRHSAREDSSPSKVCYGIGALCALPLLPGPKVLEPADELYTRDALATVSGVTEPARSGFEVTLRDRLTGRDVATTVTGDGGAWAFAVDLDLQRRYRYEVFTRDGDREQVARVPDIILDTTAPLVQALQPGPDPTQILTRLTLDLRGRFSEGDAVNVAWLATDPALLDSTNPDHGSHVDIDILFSDGPRRTVTPLGGLDYTPLVQSHAHVVTVEDVATEEREARFEVTVTDLAGNPSQSQSLPIVLDPSLLGYLPVFVRNQVDNSQIEARFPVALQGTTTPADWRIDGQVVRSATLRSGGRIVDLVASQSITDPNATPRVQFRPTGVDQLRGPDGRDISQSERVALDGIPPVLSIEAPDPGPRRADSVTVSGQTDRTSRPNTVRAVRDGQVVAQAIAAENGRFSLDIPLSPDRLNHVEVRAVDPATNVSPLRAFEVIEDSTPPVVVIDSPVPDSVIPRSLPIRWTTIDNNPDVVDIDYRVGGGDWQSLVTGAPDSGSHRWRIPASISDQSVLALRITATDRAGHRGNASTVRGLSLELSLLGPCEEVEPAPFADRDRVPSVHRFAVDCLYALGIARGTSRGGELHFHPQTDISRAQFSGFLFRTLDYASIGLPEPVGRFSDVPAGHTFDADIHRLAAAAVVLGYDERQFGPRDPIKRDQTASLLLRALGYARDEQIRPESGAYFSDTATSAHRANIDAAYEQGLVVGRSAPTDARRGIYDPGARTTRAQMATVLVRAIGQFDA